MPPMPPPMPAHAAHATPSAEGEFIRVEPHLLGLGLLEFLLDAVHRADHHDSVANAVSQPELLEDKAEGEPERNVLEVDDHG